MNNNKLLDIAEYIIQKLLDNDIVIQRYDSMSTSSIYLKLDYGVCNSIRISNHTGKKYLKYRYNLILDCEPHTAMDGYVRHYFNQNNIDEMLALILKDRKDKITKYGYSNYKDFMKKNQHEHKVDKQGFWRTARLIRKL